MPYISQSSIQELTDRMDAIAVISDYVQLEKRGGRFWACCPFHQEKTASFTVNPDLKSFYCFGCHKGGTLINFVMEMDKINFPEAIELLAKRFGVELVYEKSSGVSNYSAEDEEKKKKKDELFELYRRISGTFHHFLLEKREALPAKDYIRIRGINNEMIERFALGYAPADRYWLHKFLCNKGYSREFLAASGLFSSRDPRMSLFSGRLMFSIRDRQGRTVAFGGRYLPELKMHTQERSSYEAPKYINSPELGIYKKGEALYAIDLALPEIRRSKTVYVAEGYLDVIALHQAGITNAVAPLGTAFTEDQARLLKRWAEKVIFFFDSDDAGHAAVLKGIYNCKRNGLSCAVVSQDGGEKDPADILQKSGPELLVKQVKRYTTDFGYLLKRAALSPEKAGAVTFLFPYIDLLDSEVAKNSCIEMAADAFGLLPGIVLEDYRRYTSGQNAPSKTPDLTPRKEEIRMNHELALLITVALDYVSSKKEKLFLDFRAALEISEIEDPHAREIFIALEECIRYEESNMFEFLTRLSSPELKNMISECSATGEFSANPRKFVSDGIIKNKIKRLERRQEEIIIKLRTLKKKQKTNKVCKLTGLMTTSSKTGNFWQKKCVLIKNYSN